MADLPENGLLATLLERFAHLVEIQGGSPWRVRAFQEAAASMRALPVRVIDVMIEEGEAGVRSALGTGDPVVSAIREILTTGRLAMLERLEGEPGTEAVFGLVPGVGPTLAHRLHDELGLNSLEDLELAAIDGRLARLPGFGPRRIAHLKEELNAILSRAGRGRIVHGPPELPEVGTVLSVDSEYLLKARAGELPCISPKRFNPTRAAWLPVLHTERGGWSFTGLFSNSARAHARDMTRDWVVLYFEKKGRESRCTVVTEIHGGLQNRRVIRGREAECHAWYRPSPSPSSGVPAPQLDRAIRT
jgi:DNA polymerase (family X)